MRRIVQAEGRTARNLVTWSVPLDATDQCMFGFVVAFYEQFRIKYTG